MKKIRLYLFVLLSLLIVQASGQVINSFPWVETFEEDSETRDDWTQIFESGTNEWTFNDGSTGSTYITSAYEGDLNAMFTSSSGGPHITKFVTPVLDLSEFTVYNLSFWYGQPQWFANQNEFKLYYRTDDTDPWIELDHVTQTINEWTEFNYELPNPSATYQLAFEGIDNQGRANVIDLVTVSHLSDDNDIISFSFPEEVLPAEIDDELKTINANVVTGTGLTSLTPVIEVSDFASINPESEETLDFSDPVVYTVTSESGIEQEWTVNVTELDPLSNEKEILTFTLPEQTGPATINNTEFTIEIEVENPTDVTNLTPTITVSDEATIDPPSGTSQNFGFPVVYTVTAENLTTQDWTVYVTMEPGALGADCSNPIIVNLPEDAPFLDQEQTNCGLNNVYSGLDCGGSYFNGEEIVYQINITEAVLATFELTTTSTWTGIALLDACPNVGTCIDFSTGSGSNEIMEDIALYPGTYYLIISTFPAPNCIPEFDLNITIDEDACPVPTDIVLESITPDEATFSWTEGFIETEWNIVYGEFPIDPDTEGTLIENHSSQSITLTDLTEDTNYQLYVAAACGDDNNSEWTEGFHFKTLENCPAPSDIVSDNITHNSVDLSWTEGELNNTWNVEIGLPGFTPGNGEEQVAFNDINETNLFADGLNPDTGYAVYLQADCGEHNSSWVGPHFFDTYAVCPIPTNITAQNATNFSVDIVWNETYNNDSWDVEVGTVGFTPGNGEELFSITATDQTSWHVTGLESGTDYEAYLKANCDAEESNWSDAIEFSTITCVDNAICIYYTDGDIPSDRDFTSLPGFSNCPASVTVNIPENHWITGIDTEYDMTSQGVAWMSDARSYLYSPTAGSGEETLAEGGTSTAGTFSYSRNNLDFANNIYGTVEIQMHAGRTWGGSGCNTDYVYVEDNTWLLTIHYDEMPDCVPPIGVTISDLTGVSATINWNESISDVDGYNWVIMAEGENPDTDTPIDMGTTDEATTSIAVADLSPITGYEVYLNSICDSETSDWSGPYYFMTDCDVFDTPIFEDFDDPEISTPDLPICWNRIENSTSDFANVNTSTVNAYSDPNNIRFYNSADEDAKLLLITPPIAQPLNELYTTFFARNTSTDSHLLVGTISDVNDYTTFSVVDTIYLTTTHTQYEVYLNEVTNTDVNIAFKHLIGGTYNYVYLDDIEIKEIPDCPHVSNLSVSNIEIESVLLSWNEIGEATLWNVEIGYPGFEPGTGEELFSFMETDQNPLLIEDLTGITTYEAFVQAVCTDEEVSEWSNSFIFTTACDVVTVFPFEIGFEEDWTGDPEAPNCWTVVNGADGSYWEQSTVHTYSGDYSARTYQGSGSSYMADEWLITPQLNFDNLNIAHMTFWAYSSQTPDGIKENLRILLLDELYDNVEDLHTNATLVQEVAFPGSWDELLVNLGDIDGAKYVAFNYYITDEMNASFNWMYMDDLRIFEAPLCPTPNNLDVSNITFESINLEWEEIGSATMWNVEIGEPGFTPGEAEELFLIEETDQNPLFVDGLTDNTDYEFFVQAVCDGDEISEWSNGYTFTTACDLLAIPLFEDFDEADNPELPNCWDKIEITTSDFANVTTSTLNSVSDPNSIRLYNSADDQAILMLVAPAIDEDIDNVVVRFYAKNTNADSHLIVGSIADYTDENTFTQFDTVFLTTTHTHYTVNMNGIGSTDNRVAFKHYIGGTYKYVYMDDITIELPNDENDIIEFSFVEETGPAVIDNTEKEVHIEVSMTTDLVGLEPQITISDYATIDPVSGDAQDFSEPFVYTVTSETGVDQEWTVHVTNADALSDANDIITFSFAEETEPAIIDNVEKTVDIEVNWLAHITNLVPDITISGLATIDPASGLPQDFSEPFVYTVTAEDESEAFWTVNVSMEDSPLGANCTNPIIVELPTEIPYSDFDNTTCGMGDVYSSLDCGGSYFNGEDIIYRLDVVQETIINVELISSDTWTGIAILDDCPNTGNCIEFSTSSTADKFLEDVTLPAGTYYLIIDTWPSPPCINSFDLHITITCPEVVNLTYQDLGQEEAWITWESTATATSYNLIYGETGFDIETEGTLMEDVTNPAHITGLIGETEYDVYVEAICDVYGQSDWEGPFTFTTLAACPAPENLYADNITDSSADIGWFAIGGTDQWNVEVGNPGFNVDNGEELFAFNDIIDNPYFVDGLTLETTYEFYVQSVCGTDYSDWAGPFAFTTTCANCLVDNYSDGDIPTDYQSPWIGPSACPASMIFEIPEGYMVAGIDVSYEMTSHNGAWMSEQRSKLHSPTIDAGETAYATGDSNTAGTFSYNRNNLDFANGATGTLEIEMHAGRTWGTSPTGCNTNYAYVVNNTLAVTIHYEEIPQIDGIDINEDVTDIEVCLETSEEDAISQLVQEITISDTQGAEYVASVTWTIDSYDADVAGDYNATGEFNLPDNVEQTDPETTLEVDATITVLELPTLNCPDDMFACASDEPFELTGATPEGGEYTGFYVEDGIFDPGQGGSLDVIYYTYTDPVTGCENQCSFNIEISFGPVVNCPDDFTVDANNPIELTGGTPEGGEYTGEGVEDGFFNPDGLPNGDYTITYTYIDDESCVSSCEFVITVDIGVGIISNNNGDITIFPNPNNGEFLIDFKDITGKINYSIYDTKGSIIVSEEFHNKGNEAKEISINVAPGVYYIKLVNDETTIIEKLVIQ